MEGDLSRATAQFHRSRASTRQAAVLQPAMTLARLDRKDILDLARDYRRGFDVLRCLDDDGPCGMEFGSAFEPAGIDSVSSPLSISSDFFEGTGSRARRSSRIPFARIEDPRVAAGGSTHVLTSSTSFFSCFGMAPGWDPLRSTSIITIFAGSASRDRSLFAAHPSSWASPMRRPSGPRM